jgi:hypothetical protein
LAAQVAAWALHFEDQLLARLTKKERALYFAGELLIDTAEFIKQRARETRGPDDGEPAPAPEPERVAEAA